VTTISETIAQHVAAARYEALPAEVALFTKRLVLDTLAVAWAEAARRKARSGCSAAAGRRAPRRS